MIFFVRGGLIAYKNGLRSGVSSCGHLDIGVTLIMFTAATLVLSLGYE